MFPVWIEYIVFWIDSIKLQCCEVLWRILPESKNCTRKVVTSFKYFQYFDYSSGSSRWGIILDVDPLPWILTCWIFVIKKEKSYLHKSVNKIKYMNFISFEKDIYM